MLPVSSLAPTQRPCHDESDDTLQASGARLTTKVPQRAASPRKRAAYRWSRWTSNGDDRQRDRLRSPTQSGTATDAPLYAIDLSATGVNENPTAFVGLTKMT